MINMLKGTLQVAGFMLLLGMDQLAAWLNIGIPSILGIVVVFILLETKVLRLEWIELGAIGRSPNCCCSLSLLRSAS